MPDNYNALVCKTTQFSVLEALKNNINYNMNCIKVAIVESFDAENLVVCCRVANKRLIDIKKDGNQVLQDYPLIYAKVHYIGWGDTGITYPITKGMEGFLLFNDREMETWFLTGGSGNLAYERCHDLSDAIFVCGLHSKPNMISLVDFCLNLFYKTSSIQVKNGDINIKSTSQIVLDSPNISTTGNLNVGTGISAVVPCGSATLTFSNGILTGVT